MKAVMAAVCALLLAGAYALTHRFEVVAAKVDDALPVAFVLDRWTGDVTVHWASGKYVRTEPFHRPEPAASSVP